ncbi:hypothetical protein XELAEV_18024396mg [Xenopus laevis]|uniref:Uncharacterized protein n=1 Tax=Xenopus laevis TaxID=8355 RepID=A0A974HKY3_XENLA|nr:hypothetical protein XELAEV_18024396mg [Xenopus laevis]
MLHQISALILVTLKENEVIFFAVIIPNSRCSVLTSLPRSKYLVSAHSMPTTGSQENHMTVRSFFIR